MSPGAIASCCSSADQKGFTIVPLRMYLKDNRAKVEIGLAKGKREYDKREAIADREADRTMQREIKEALG